MRIELVLSASRLDVEGGERASVVLNDIFHTRDDAMTYISLCEDVKSSCEQLSSMKKPPQNPGEFAEVSNVFMIINIILMSTHFSYVLGKLCSYTILKLHYLCYISLGVCS